MLLLCLLCMACHKGKESLHGESTYLPLPPDYGDSTMWYLTSDATADTGADVFYIPSTWEFDWWTADSLLCHYADVHNPQHRAHMAIEQAKVAEYMAEGRRFYSPYYRHITLNTWATLNDDTIVRRYQALSLPDVQAAFHEYLTRFNQGRPFVLAGFSQGAKSVVELLKRMDGEVRSRLVAAYVLGYKVTPEDVAECPAIVPARDSADVGVTICYNSVSDVRYVQPLVSSPTVCCINPVNWRTDDTPAVLQDSITVTLSVPHQVLVVQGFDASGYPPILGILNVGDYHGAEPWLYSDCLRRNMQLRVAEYMKKKLRL